MGVHSRVGPGQHAQGAARGKRGGGIAVLALGDREASGGALDTAQAHRSPPGRDGLGGLGIGVVALGAEGRSGGHADAAGAHAREPVKAVVEGAEHDDVAAAGGQGLTILVAEPARVDEDDGRPLGRGLAGGARAGDRIDVDARVLHERREGLRAIGVGVVDRQGDGGLGGLERLGDDGQDEQGEKREEHSPPGAQALADGRPDDLVAAGARRRFRGLGAWDGGRGPVPGAGDAHRRASFAARLACRAWASRRA